MSVNKVILLGRLGNDPELKCTPKGSSVCEFRMATRESWNDKSGQRQERTEWHRIVVWGKLSELCNQYLSKGRQCYVEGRLQTRSWEGKDGQKHYTTEVNASTVQFIGGPSEGTKKGWDGLNDYAQKEVQNQNSEKIEADSQFTVDSIPF